MPRSSFARTAAPRLLVIVLVAVTALSAAVLAGCGGKSAEARRRDASITRGSNPVGLVTMTVCGLVLSYRAGGRGDPDEGGRLELDCGGWDLEPDAPVAFEALLTPDERVCVHAELAGDQRIRGAYVFEPAAADRAADAPL